MRVLGLDIGERTIGVAVSDPLGLSARGLGVIRRKGGAHDLEALARLARAVEAERVLIAGGVSRKKRRRVIDQQAAIVILQSWLSEHAGRPEAIPNGPPDATEETP